MIDVDVSRAVNQQGDLFRFEYSGCPEMPDLAFDKPLRLQAEYSVSDETVRLIGTMETVLEVACTRCLDEVPFAVECDFDETFTKDGADDSYTYNGNIVELDKMVYDYLMLSLPQKILCGDDCKGLCPQCGANRNREACDCSNQVSDDENNPFNKLKDLFKDGEV